MQTDRQAQTVGKTNRVRETEGDELTETEKREVKEERQTQTAGGCEERGTDRPTDDWQKQRGRHTNKEREDKTKRVKQRDKGREMN